MFEIYLQKAEEIVSKMTLKEKIGQLNQITVDSCKNDAEQLYTMIRNGEVGSMILASSATAGNDAQGLVNIDFYKKLQKIAVEESRLHIPMIFGRDVIHGHKTVFPLPLASAAAFNGELIEKCYRDIAAEAAADGIHWTFSPMLDVCHDPRWGRIVEGPGEDPFVGTQMAKACIKGFQGQNLADKTSIIACAKHYIGYGASEGGKDYFRTEISDATLNNYILPPFRAAVEAGVGTVMSSFNDINGIPVTGSKKYLTEILRNRLGFSGFVVSDWCAVEQLEHAGFSASRKESTEKALNAGLDMDMVDLCFAQNLEDLVENEKVSVEAINTAAKRIICIKLAAGLFERPYAEVVTYDKAQHSADAKELAAESMVLLKNCGILPLNKNAKIIAAGPFLYERRSLLGTWTLDGCAEATPNFYEALKNTLGNRLLCAEESDDLSVFSGDTVILALGENYLLTGENRSVSDISVPSEQRELIEKAHSSGKKVIGVFFCGRPRALGDVEEKLDAILYAWHSGSETAAAASDILFGDIIPSGKTPVTFPRKATHIPLYYNITSSGRAVNGYYGERPEANYTDSMASPLYPFGYGLSYTEFEYSNLRIDKEKMPLESLRNGDTFTVTVSLKNAGKYDAKETVQLYIRDKVASLLRPLRELKGYKKVFLKKGETAEISFALSYKDLGFYTENGEYTVEKGEFEIYVGENCLTKNKIKVWVE
ncbi:MAG: glycoside hydrolase family 3 C-terminal domain-containing protein [Clostridiales bacterium]|nr:glycoside hydrolase family 3 C-terminal domain-containing protein [Candidatus Equinaster intestinalis]